MLPLSTDHGVVRPVHNSPTQLRVVRQQIVHFFQRRSAGPIAPGHFGPIVQIDIGVRVFFDERGGAFFVRWWSIGAFAGGRVFFEAAKMRDIDVQILETVQWAASYRVDAHVHSSHTRPKWIEVSQAAIEHAKIGLARSEAYIGTLEVWLSVYQNSIFHTKDKALARRTRLRISAALMGLAPDRESLLLIVAAAAESGNPEQDVLEVCLKFADVVPGYGEDMCVIEAALHHYLGHEIKEAARAALATQTSPYVDDAWLGYQLSASRNDAKTDDSDRMIALQLKRLHGRVDLDQFRRDAGIIMAVLTGPTTLRWRMVTCWTIWTTFCRMTR